MLAFRTAVNNGPMHRQEAASMDAMLSVAGQPRTHLQTSDFAYVHSLLRHKDKTDN